MAWRRFYPTRGEALLDLVFRQKRDLDLDMLTIDRFVVSVISGVKVVDTVDLTEPERVRGSPRQNVTWTQTPAWAALARLAFPETSVNAHVLIVLQDETG